MNEIVLGVGQDKDLLEIVEAAEQELRTLHGPPRQLVLRGREIEVQAARPQLEGPFEQFAVRTKLDATTLPLVQEIVADASACCTLAESEAASLIECRAGDESEQDVCGQVLGRLTLLLNLPDVWRVRGENYRTDALSAEALLRYMVENRASDVHLYPGACPIFRVDGAVGPSDEFGVLSAAQILDLLKELAPEEAWRAFERERQCGFRYHHLGLGFARVSAFIKAGVPHVTLRHLRESIPTFEDLNVPRELMERIAAFPVGLVLVTGMTGSGKSTTIASLIDWLNERKALHILTIEEPVEYVHRNKKSVVSQREVGVDVPDFQSAVRGALRHDPDVIFIGEMRDADTIRSAINAASTGHLVLSTMHANTTAEVINRIVSFFDPVERDLVRLQIRDCLRCIVCQRFVPTVSGSRMAALEFLFNDTVHVAEAIQAGDTETIRVAMQQTVSLSSLLEQALVKLVKDKLVDSEQAKIYAANRDVFEQLLLGTYSVPSLDSMSPLRKTTKESFEYR
ncbi:MAG: PilT/PilU family type 4a pilus ATPase [Pirellulaceae bacterium]